MRKPLIPAILLALGFGWMPHDARAHEVTGPMAAAAQDFLNSLEPEQLKKASFALDDEERFNWHYIPLERHGLPIREMRTDQRVLAYGLLSTGLSHTGYLKAVEIMSLERLLWELENHAAKRDPEYYLVSVFGKPDPKGTWGWRFEGHHLSVNFTIVNGELVAETPAFMGANPGNVVEGPRKGLRVLGHEEDFGRDLVKALSDDQKKKAVIAEKAPDDVLTKDLPKVDPLQAEGIPFAELTDAQKVMLWKIVDEYLGNEHPVLAAEERKRVESETGELRFAWAGGFEFGQGHYYRLQGKTFVLEYCNVQNGAMHPHAAWRNFGEDFGRDLLREHIAKEHSGS